MRCGGGFAKLKRACKDSRRKYGFASSSHHATLGNLGYAVRSKVHPCLKGRESELEWEKESGSLEGGKKTDREASRP